MAKKNTIKVKEVIVEKDAIIEDKEFKNDEVIDVIADEISFQKDELNASKSSKSENSKYTIYVVKKNDTLKSIADAHYIYWKKLYARNKFIIGNNPENIKPGQELIIEK